MPISLTRQLALQNGEPPYTYVWGTDSNCATIANPSGVSSDGILNLEITATSPECLTDAVFTATGTDANGCEFSESVTLGNPCSLVLGAVSQVGELHLTVAASDPDCLSVQFEWTYPTQFLESLGQTDGPKTSALRLGVKAGSYPSGFYTVTVKATNCYGCTKSQSINVSVCTPQLKSFSVPVVCTRTRAGLSLTSSKITVPHPDNCSSDIDWKNIQFSLPAGFTVSKTTGVTVRNGVTIQNAFSSIQITASDTLPAGNYTGSYSATTKDGRAALPANINLTITDCQAESTFELTSGSFYVPCEVTPGDTVLIPIEQYVVGDADWLTAQVLQVSSGTATIENRVLDGVPQYVIVYTTPDPITNANITWRVADQKGMYPGGVVMGVVPCVAAPTLTSDTATAFCGTQTTIDVLANDNANSSGFITSSLRIVQPPTRGYANVSNGKIYYTPEDGYAGVDTLTYTVKNAFYQEASPVPVSITVTCTP